MPRASPNKRASVVKPRREPKVRQSPAHAFSRIRQLGEEKVLKVNNEMARGLSIARIARMIQQDWGDLQDIAANTLEQQLHRYRMSLETGRLTEAKVSLEDGETKLKFLKGRDIDVFAEMVALVRLQASRVQTFYDREKGMGLPLSGVEKVIETYKELLLSTQKLKFELGLDEFHGPMQGGVRGFSQTTQLPDGTLIKQQMLEAVQTAESILDKYSVTHVTNLHDDNSSD